MLFGMEHQHTLLSFGSDVALGLARRSWTGSSFCTIFSLCRRWREAGCGKCGMGEHCLEEEAGRPCLVFDTGRSGWFSCSVTSDSNIGSNGAEIGDTSGIVSLGR